jgi:hypothetical protein
MVRSIRNALLPLAVACGALLALSSCASIQRGADEGVVKRVAALINSGDSKSLASMSVSPFLVDGEIVPLPDDVAAFWVGIAAAGFKVDGAALDTGSPVAADSFKQFAGTTEVRFWFSRYAKGARVISLQASGGRHILLVARPDWFTWKLLGFKGPF